jgi:hypothetical protein
MFDQVLSARRPREGGMFSGQSVLPVHSFISDMGLVNTVLLGA